MSLDATLKQIYGLKMGKLGDHERPHKPLLLLAVLDLIDTKIVRKNTIPVSDELIGWWNDYFEIVKAGNDKPTPENPFYFMSGDGFWHLDMKAGCPPMYVAGNVGRSPSIKQLREKVNGARLDAETWAIFSDTEDRELCRHLIISRYFSPQREALLEMAAAHRLERKLPLNYQSSELVALSRVSDAPVRSRAFAQTVVSAYEHQCAACGLRIRTARGTTMVDAAHLMPFRESFDDHPGNGMALCKNHHWAMDQNLIAPGSDMKWHASGELDDRQEGQANLMALEGRNILLPKEKAYYPKSASLIWRQERLP